MKKYLWTILLMFLLISCTSKSGKKISPIKTQKEYVTDILILNGEKEIFYKEMFFKGDISTIEYFVKQFSDLITGYTIDVLEIDSLEVHYDIYELNFKEL